MDWRAASLNSNSEFHQTPPVETNYVNVGNVRHNNNTFPQSQVTLVFNKLMNILHAILCCHVMFSWNNCHITVEHITGVNFTLLIDSFSPVVKHIFVKFNSRNMQVLRLVDSL